MELQTLQAHNSQQTVPSTSSAAAAVVTESVSGNNDENDQTSEPGESQKSIEERVAL